MQTVLDWLVTKRGGVMTAENIAMLIASLLLFIVGFKLGEERGKGERDGQTDL